MRSLTMLAVAAALGLCGALLAACGDRSELIPADAASEMDDRLDEASFALAEGDCRQAARDLRTARQQAIDLPESVDGELKASLERGIEHALERAEIACRPKTTTTTATTPTVTKTEPPPQTKTTPPPTTTPTTPPDGPGSGGTSPDDNGGGNNDGGGGGNSGGGGGNSGGNSEGGSSGGNSPGGDGGDGDG